MTTAGRYRVRMSIGAVGESKQVVPAAFMVVAAGGITWFRRMVIRRAGSPYFEMDISALRTAAGLDNPMLRGERRP